MEDRIIDAENQASFSGWAKVEVMGHQSHIFDPPPNTTLLPPPPEDDDDDEGGPF